MKFSIADLQSILEWREDCRHWYGHLALLDEQGIEILIFPEDREDKDILKKAQEMIPLILEYDSIYRDEIMRPLLDHYNKHWCPAGRELKYEEFKERMELSGICFDVHNRSIEASYHDMTEDADPESQIFGGHIIDVPINDDGSFGEPYMSG